MYPIKSLISRTIQLSIKFLNNLYMINQRIKINKVTYFLIHSYDCRARTEREAGRGEPRDTWGDQGGRDYPNKFPFRPREVDEDRRAEWDERRDDRRNNYYQHDDRDGRNGDRRGMMVGNGGGGMGGGRGRMGGGPMGGGGMKRGRQESEPEWMSESVSMSDMIELR